MKNILKIAVLFTALLIAFASCAKKEEVSIEKTWKFTMMTEGMLLAPKQDVGQLQYAAVPTDVYVTITGQVVIISTPVPAQLAFFIPDYKDRLVILATAAYSHESTSKTTGKIVLVNADTPWTDEDGNTTILYTELTDKSMTFTIKGEDGVEEKYTLTVVVSRPDFITYDELEQLIPYS